MKGNFFGGTSGLQIDRPKRNFPPEYSHLSRLGYYALQENSIEINSSFYQLPQAKTVTRWTKEVTPGFRFTFKFWREITHQKNLLFHREEVHRFMEVIHLPEKPKGMFACSIPAEPAV